MKRFVLSLMLLLLFALLLACSNDDQFAASGGGFKDPYDAYGLIRGESYSKGESLYYAMLEDPPSTIVLEPAFYYRANYATIPQSGEITIEKGKSANVSLDLELIHTSGETAKVSTTITLNYDGIKDENLFTASTSTSGNPTLFVDGVYVTEYGTHNVSDKEIFTEEITSLNGYQYSLNGPDEEFLCIPLWVDKGSATSGDGNIGLLYCRILKIKK